jgi:hypothetical protein
MVFIYVLQLTQDKFYIGKTDNPKFRINSHFKKGGCAWTKKYNPTQIIGLFPDCDDFDEDKYTLKYMSKYGIDNVRGGSFCQTDLSSENKKMIERMITGSNDCCHFCGEKGHFIGKCPNKKIKKEYSKQNNHFLELSKDYESADEVEWEEESDDEEDNLHIPWTRNGPFQLGQGKYNVYDLPAYSCGCSNGCGKSFSSREREKNHRSKYCKTKPWKGKKEWWQCSYCLKGFDTKEGAQFHENIHCKAEKHIHLQYERGHDKITPQYLVLVFRELDKYDGIYICLGKKHLWYQGELYVESEIKTPKKLLKYFERNGRESDYGNYNWKSIYETNKKKPTRKGGCHKCG